MRYRCKPKRLSAYLDGALRGRQARDLERHLLLCARCREEVGALRRIRSLFGEWTPAPPRPFFVARLNRRLNAESKSRLWVWWEWAAQRLVPAALTVASAGAVVFLVLHITAGPEPVTVDSYLRRSLGLETQEIAAFTESDLSKDRVLDIVIAGGSQ